MTVDKGSGSNPEATQAGRALLPCTPTQERFWFLTQLRPDDSSSAVAVLWEVKGLFQSAAFEEAFRAIIQRHEIFRTRFVETDGEPMQEVLERAAFNLSVIDVSMLPLAVRRERAREICERESKIPFNLEVPPLLRAAAIRLDDASALLLIVVHHAIFDGTSIGVLGRELGEIVSALYAKRTPALPALALQYGDYALWHSEYMSKGGLDEDHPYWQQKLQDLPTFEVAPDHPRPEQGSSRNESLSSPLDAGLGDSLEATARKSGISFFALGCAIIAAMLSECTGKSDIVIGTQVSGRDDVDLEPLIGAFVNNLVLRFEAPGNRSFSDFANDVASTVRDALVHQHMPFDQLVRLLNPKRDMSRMPLYSINVILQPAFMEDANYGDFSLISTPSPTVGMLTDLNFLMVKRPAGWRMTLEYSTDLFERRTAERLFALWTAAMQFAVSSAQLSLSDFGRAVSEKAASASLRAAPQPGGKTSQPRPPEDDTSGKILPVAQPIDVAAVPVVRDIDRKAIEQKLIEVWRSILRVQNVSPDSSFFDLGGHSFSAMRMLAKASEILGVKVDPVKFFRAPTISALVRYTGQDINTDDWRIVPIQPLGSKPPLIAINGATGYYKVYSSLSAKLGMDQPVISIQPYDPATPADLGGRPIEDIAADYLHFLRLVDNAGPYILVGHCAFGLVAYEVAQQLRMEGKPVLGIVMFDTWIPNYVRSYNRFYRFLIRFLSRLLVHKNRLKRLLRGEITLGECLASYNLARRFFPLLKQFGFKVGLRDGVPDEDWYLAEIIRVRSKYQPGQFDGDVLLIASDDCAKGRLFDPELGWRRYVKGRVAIRRVGGYHMTMGYGGRAALIAEHIKVFFGKS